jgi:mono/diheme cytochrome c family protein
MYPARFVEAGCVKCHHQLTDLIRKGSQGEAPKLLKGWELVRENGCFGCHEIASMKSGREVGPDLRLEPAVPLELLPAEQQARLLADTASPPGTMRKVGPSLMRITEKTNEKWARRWIDSPRGFRPNTKMPHFYNLSTNNAEALKGTGQEAFPAAEIHSIVYYLFTESDRFLSPRKDDTPIHPETFRKVLGEQQQALVNKLHGGQELTLREKLNLDEASRRLGDLALLAVPANARQINEELSRQKQLQDSLYDLVNNYFVPLNARSKHLEQAIQVTDPDKQEDLKAELNDIKQKLPPIGAGIESTFKALSEVNASLAEASTPVPVAKQILGEDGNPIAPSELQKAEAAPNDPALGRKLFTEKGCLACHSHEGTTKKEGGLPGVSSEATFGPNLSRLAAKINPEKGDKRRWIVQWLLNPNVHSSRTRMPIVHLTLPEAVLIGDWLLGQKNEETTEWEKGPDVPAPDFDTLVQLARLYLTKAPGMTQRDLERVLQKKEGSDNQLTGFAVDGTEFDLRDWPVDADERVLKGPVGADQLKWYIGKKSIGRMGCYGCHNIFGFEFAKPIGTTLNDWGRKDPERLAFEDIIAYVKGHNNIVDRREDPQDKSKPAADWVTKDGKEPYEAFFFDALEHHQREGFLNQKLAEPRSFDYGRIRAWDDRLRMPQFKFSRSLTQPEGSPEAEMLEAVAREQLMTFVLGLVAEPIPLAYLNQPTGDRMAEVRGRQIIEKYNCAGCHQVRSGVYDYKVTDEAIEALDKVFKRSESALKEDFVNYHEFLVDNAWGPLPRSTPSRLEIRGVPGFKVKEEDEEDDSKKPIPVRLTEALRYTAKSGDPRDLLGGTAVSLLPGNITRQSSPFGGTFADLLIDYLVQQDPNHSKPPSEDDVSKARGKLPPPLEREGAKVQPGWLFNFLRNPSPIRPVTVLRMPKFNMSEEEAMSLASYFAAVDRQENPGIGLTAPFLTVPQRDESYWREMTHLYVERLKKANKLDERVKELKPIWKAQAEEQLAAVKRNLDTAAKVLASAKTDDEKKRAGQTKDDLQKQVNALDEQIKKDDFQDLRRTWEERDAYATDGYRMLTNPASFCLQCHQVGRVPPAEAKGPPLQLALDRLRPEWTARWLGNPNRLLSYAPTMPQNYPNGSNNSPEFFEGTALQKVTALRDVLMDLSRVSDLPENRNNQRTAPRGQ